MRIRLTLSIALLLFWGSFSAQDGWLEYRDNVYVDNIRTAQLHITGLLTSYPIIRLGSNGALTLAFDDMDADSKYYFYTVIHCDREWKPSELDFYEYVDGFESEEIDYFERSINTLVPFTHYTLQFPNEDFRITKSGNYLLVIFLDDPAYPVITKRFMVADPVVNIHPNMTRPADVSKLRTHQEVDFEVSAEILRVRDVKNDIYAVVLQNGRWDNAIQGLQSKFERGGRFIFDYQNEIVFPAGLDFRNMDIRSTLYRSRDVFEILRENNRKRIVAEIDQPRTYSTYLTDIDVNGKYIIRTLDDQRYGSVDLSPDSLAAIIASGALDGLSQAQAQRDITVTVDLTEHDLQADYIDVLFTLQTDTPYDSDVFLFGGLTDWLLQDRFKMTWDPQYEAYFADVQLKQGFYDYIYVLANKDGSPDESTIEGNWYEASNDYTILIYHTPFGSRYDELVGALTIPASQ